MLTTEKAKLQFSVACRRSLLQSGDARTARRKPPVSTSPFPTGDPSGRPGRPSLAAAPGEGAFRLSGRPGSDMQGQARREAAATLRRPGMSRDPQRPSPPGARREPRFPPHPGDPRWNDIAAPRPWPKWPEPSPRGGPKSLSVLQKARRDFDREIFAPLQKVPANFEKRARPCRITWRKQRTCLSSCSSLSAGGTATQTQRCTVYRPGTVCRSGSCGACAIARRRPCLGTSSKTSRRPTPQPAERKPRGCCGRPTSWGQLVDLMRIVWARFELWLLATRLKFNHRNLRNEQ